MQENREAVDEDALKKIEEPGINLLIVYFFFSFLCTECMLEME
jgi:hypothetical protein